MNQNPWGWFAFTNLKHAATTPITIICTHHPPSKSPPPLAMHNKHILLSRIHKNLLRTSSDQDITRIQQQEFSKWFKERINILREEESPEATDDLWSDGVEGEVVTRVRSSIEVMIENRNDEENEEYDEPDVDYDMDLDVDQDL
ncbi:hypothetical protein AAC387_Pa05g0964 [Persea americana]